MSSLSPDGSSLPRSIRWRMQIGLLDVPLSPDRTISEQNFSKVLRQRDRFEKLQMEEHNNAQSHQEQIRSTAHESFNGALQNCSLDDIDDPLTAALKQREAQEQEDRAYRTSHKWQPRRASEKYRRRSSVRLQDEAKHQVSEIQLEVIQKDVARLDPVHAQHYHSRENWIRHEGGLDPQEYQQSLEARNARLTELLTIYASRPGHTYYQGMHELCSYFLFVREMDLFDLETSPQPEFDYLLEGESALHDTYVLFEAVMVLLCRCFEESDAMSNSIVAKIPYVARDKDLYNHIQAIPMSHEVYCARWLRLMFGREVSGWRNVLSLWDIFFDLTTENESVLSMDASRYTRPGLEDPLKLGTWELDQVLEMTAASLIWLKRKELLARQADDVMDLLVNYEPLQSAAPLLGTLLTSLHRMQTNEHMAPLLPPSQEGSNGFIKLINISNVPVLRRLSHKSMDSSSGTAHGHRRRSMTVHRRSSIQNLADNSKHVRELLTDSDDEDDEYIDHFDFNSCDGTTMSCLNSDDGQASLFDDDRTVRTTETSRRVSILTLARSVGRKAPVNEDEDSHATELNVIGRSISAKPNDDDLTFSLEDFSETRDSDESESGTDDCMDTSTRVEGNMALCIGLNMAF